MTVRKIKKILRAQPTLEGAGVQLKRVFGFHQVPLLDPFLLLDDFRGDNPAHYLKGFPWHPHRGIETITYMLDGSVEHGDSLGNQGVIKSGDVQWMTAGSGIIHQEMPKGDAKDSMGGFQLWANLPASHKMMAPRYQEVKSPDIRTLTKENGITIKIICGEVNGIRGPVQNIVIDPDYLDISIPANTEYLHQTKNGYTVFAYVIEGKACFDENDDAYAYEADGANYFDMDRECIIPPHTLVLYEDGDRLLIRTESSPVRLLLISGKPINEPVAWYGPIVMNTQQELKRAFQEYQDGTFIK